VSCSGVSPVLMCLQSCFISGDWFSMPLVDVIDCLAEEVFVPIYFYDV
jgi:hypothetical protein